MKSLTEQFRRALKCGLMFSVMSPRTSAVIRKERGRAVLEFEQLDTHNRRAKQRTATPSARDDAHARDDSLRETQHAHGNRSLGRLLLSAASESARARTHAREAPELEAARASVKGGGKPLPHSERSYFEPLFGQDFDGVRLHAESGAARPASHGSRAYALGEAIVFAPGHYAPGTSAGRRLLAHELAHVVQQRQHGERKST